jgi:hypothetical protein
MIIDYEVWNYTQTNNNPYKFINPGRLVLAPQTICRKGALL